MPKRATKKKSRRRSSTADLCLWLVPFTFDRSRTKQRGSFQMVVEAVTPDDAMARCHQRLLELAATTSFFKEPVKFYSDGLIRLTGRFNEPVLLNFELPDMRGRISNLMPEQAEHDAMMFVADLDATRPIEPFVIFGICRFAGSWGHPFAGSWGQGDGANDRVEIASDRLSRPQVVIGVFTGASGEIFAGSWGHPDGPKAVRRVARCG
jgi:hypothetical protein